MVWRASRASSVSKQDEGQYRNVRLQAHVLHERGGSKWNKGRASKFWIEARPPTPWQSSLVPLGYRAMCLPLNPSITARLGDNTSCPIIKGSRRLKTQNIWRSRHCKLLSCPFFVSLVTALLLLDPFARSFNIPGILATIASLTMPILERQLLSSDRPWPARGRTLRLFRWIKNVEVSDKRLFIEPCYPTFLIWVLTVSAFVHYPTQQDLVGVFRSDSPQSCPIFMLRILGMLEASKQLLAYCH